MSPSNQCPRLSGSGIKITISHIHQGPGAFFRSGLSMIATPQGRLSTRLRLLRQSTDNVNFTIRYVLTILFRGCNFFGGETDHQPSIVPDQSGPQGCGCSAYPQHELLAPWSVVDSDVSFA